MAPMARADESSAENLGEQFSRREESGTLPRRGRDSSGSQEIAKCLGERSPAERGGDDRVDLLATIQEQIIPRLVLAHFDDPIAAEACPDTRLPPDVEEVAEFSRIAAAQDLPRALSFIEVMVRQGVSIGTVLLHLVAPAARKLGDDWLDDLRSFAEVSLGLGTLQEVVHILGPSFAPGLGDRGAVLLVAAPGEQHTLGVHVLGEFIRRAGWSVEVASAITRAVLLRRVASELFEMVGISVSNEQLLEPLIDVVRDVKKRSLNPDVAVMIGGSLNLAEHAEAIGAIFCNDPGDAVRRLSARAKSAGRDSRS
jgi:methanogenic corrinoid protein MtbC1